ncbi:MAG TPA: hypothetical protein VEW04_03925 [Allosphingosinicella sp.]|nr:hypothetical protein [Allosphingosinicella sp.]
MKYLVTAAALLALPQMALAQQVTGTINLTGVVAGRCSVLAGGQAFSETINLGELSGNDGRLRTDLTDASPDAVRNYSIVCTSATPRVILSATRLSTGTTAPAGYANNIDYTAQVAVLQASGTPPSITYVTASALPAPTNVQLTAPLANAADNVTVRVHSFRTAAGALLVAGSYTSVIQITISPT